MKQMGSYMEEEEDDDQFFDSREDISSLPDSSLCSDLSQKCDLNSGLCDWVWDEFHREDWDGEQCSIQNRRIKFLSWMGLSGIEEGHAKDDDDSRDEIKIDSDEIYTPRLRSSSSENRLSSPECSSSDWTSDIAPEEGSVCRVKNLDDGKEFIVDELDQDGSWNRLREVGSNLSFTLDEFERSLGSSPFVQRYMRREIVEENNLSKEENRNKGWLKKLGIAVCVIDGDHTKHKIKRCDEQGCGSKPRGSRVRVQTRKKKFKEFSALYMDQEIDAHESSIFTMKFSSDGKYLASAGEDCVVRVWKVIECERDLQISKSDPSCLYFMMNYSYQLTPHFLTKEKMDKPRNLRMTSHPRCVVFPPKLFQMVEKAIHEFHGHLKDVLDLSWSQNQYYLLSSSMDRTVRLWQVGGDNRCLKVFPHTDYVTCIQFNPFDDNEFISGSIDGKIRVWEISGCRVIDWIDIKDIVTAVCYHPNSQGVVVGSMTGNCRFYDSSSHVLQLVDQICLPGKKKSLCKRITGLQFLPNDSSKVMVTCADSQVLILEGVEVICKYKGLGNVRSQISASFTSDGKYIISASEDSSICVWNYSSQEFRSNQTRCIQSYERFSSFYASIAIPWPGLKRVNSIPIVSAYHVRVDLNRNQTACCVDPLGINARECAPSNGFLSEIPPKGSATWPEEKLPTSTLPMSTITRNSRHKFKGSHQDPVSSHAWGLVIVTAGRDGRIRSFHNYGLPLQTKSMSNQIGLP